MLRNLVVVAVVLGMTGAVAGLHAAKAPKTVVIDACKNKKPGVTFHHEKHAKARKIGCKTCHHKGKQQKCVNCHKGKADGKKPGCAEMSLKKNPFHIRCIGCHKEQKKGPKTCKACHK